MMLDTLLKTLLNPSTLIPIAAILVVAVIAIILSKQREKNKGTKEPKEKMPYLLKESVLSKAEFEFSKELAKYVARDCMILTKVSLHDIFEVDRNQIDNKEYLKYFNKYSSKHVDFLICDRITFKPLYGVELDDSSHNSAKTMQRDEFVNKLYSHVGLKLVRIKYRTKYSQDDFSEIIKIRDAMNGAGQSSL